MFQSKNFGRLSFDERICFTKHSPKSKSPYDPKGNQKTKLGEVLGTKNPNESQQQKYLRASRFLDTDAKIPIDKLLNVADFFEKPIEYFLSSSNTLCSPDNEKEPNSKPLEEIERNLRKMHLDESFIQNQLQQLRAMEAYGSTKNKDNL